MISCVCFFLSAPFIQQMLLPALALRQNLLLRGCKPMSLSICLCCQEISAVSRVHRDFTSLCPVLYAVLQLRAVSNLFPSFSQPLTGSFLTSVSSLRCWKAEHIFSTMGRGGSCGVGDLLEAEVLPVLVASLQDAGAWQGELGQLAWCFGSL